MNATRGNRDGNGWNQENRPRAKWVSKEEMRERRRLNLCYNCGGEHTQAECTLARARKPKKTAQVTVMKAIEAPPTGEVEEEDSDGDSRSGKE